ncbi:hypothetical protein TrVE_jg5880 [Triparma verrucosa]|uniref:Uncharacterized protein n=1 Tax=Triparma verrucosa TaxID=1606542 RepID=A0A9W7FF08_9STRA|nr:hypothetical protein TrVE_jg5880 [Triparma verrucosa]
MMSKNKIVPMESQSSAALSALSSPEATKGRYLTKNSKQSSPRPGYKRAFTTLGRAISTSRRNTSCEATIVV